MGERVTAASGPGQWAALARALEPCKTHPQPVPSASQLPCRPKEKGRGEGRDPSLTSLSADIWLNGSTKCHSLIVGRLREGLTVAPING